jgi:hypothetical protein
LYSPLVSFWRQGLNCGCDIGNLNATECNTDPHVTHTGSTSGNRTGTEPLPSVNDIMAIAQLETQEDAIIIAQNEIAYLDDMSLEGDTNDDVSDIREVVRKALFTSS